MISWVTNGCRARTQKRATSGLRSPALALLILMTLWARSMAGDWPTYRYDNARSGVTAESLKLPLTECWVYQPRHAPEPAWGEPNPRPVGGWYGLTERRRVHFDDAFHVVVSGGAVYFGSSADGNVVSLDARTGQERWRVLTGGPVRLAPTVWQDNVYVGSDDGFVYCLRCSDGGAAVEVSRGAERTQGAGQRQDDLAVAGAHRRAGRRRHRLFRRGHLSGGRRLHVRGRRRGRAAGLVQRHVAAPRRRAASRRRATCWPRRIVCSRRWAACRPPRSTARTAACCTSPTSNTSSAARMPLLADDQLFTGTEQMIGLRSGVPPCPILLVLGPSAGRYAGHVLRGDRERAVRGQPRDLRSRQSAPQGTAGPQTRS